MPSIYISDVTEDLTLFIMTKDQINRRFHSIPDSLISVATFLSFNFRDFRGEKSVNLFDDDPGAKTGHLAGQNRSGLLVSFSGRLVKKLAFASV